MGLMDELLAAYGALTPEEQAKVEAEVEAATGDRAWFPNPGPQTVACLTEADELFYGGQAGGGKSDLICGLALTDHTVSLLLRRQNADTIALEDRLADILGSREGLNSQKHIYRLDGGRVIEIGGVQFEKDKQKYKGRPHDLIAFDEIADFTETQYRFIIGWNRSTKPGQRCRVVATGNPPTTPEGLWVLKHWGAWLDPTHPNPAKDGELRWYTTIGDRDVEVASGEPVEVDGEMVQPRSRTFIRSRLSDNPDLATTDYDATLAALPPELRDAYRGGKFNVVRADQPQQVIPTAWIQMAQERWTDRPPEHTPMTCLFHDVALGGGDANAWARRHALWFDEVIKEKLKGFVDPIELAARDIELVRDGAAIVIDMGGGYGSGVFSHLKQSVPSLITDRRLIGFNGASASNRRDRSGKLGFKNRRAEVHWMFREALEPGLGLPVMLPPDPELLADLAAPTWKLGPQGIVIEDKVQLRARLGRSPDKGDCVLGAWAHGESAVSTNWRLATVGAHGLTGTPRVILGHAAQKARRAGRR
jgi:hypothetical protein